MHMRWRKPRFVLAVGCIQSIGSEHPFSVCSDIFRPEKSFVVIATSDLIIVWPVIAHAGKHVIVVSPGCALRVPVASVSIKLYKRYYFLFDSIVGSFISKEIEKNNENN